MPLSSMTGFARAESTLGPLQWTWEVKSLNNKGLDIRMRLPAGCESMEPAVRTQISARIKRGACHVGLKFFGHNDNLSLRLNPQALEQALAAAQEIQNRIGGAPVGVDTLMNQRGVIELFADPTSDEDRRTQEAAMMDTLASAMDALVAMREREGKVLGKVLSQQVGEIQALVDTIATSPAGDVAAIKTRIGEQMRLLVDAANGGLEPGRLHQEAALIATKSDIREEIDRLRAHCEAARELLESDQPVGRRLDFLAQEFNREVNTVCAKAHDVAVIRSALELKSVVEQMREQVQNIE